MFGSFSFRSPRRALAQLSVRVVVAVAVVSAFALAACKTNDVSTAPKTDPKAGWRANKSLPDWMRYNRATIQKDNRFWQKALKEVYRSSEELRAQDEREHRKGITFSKLLQGNPNRKEIALTFDDGPHQAWTRKLLAVLRKLDVKATFFVVGKMAERFPQLVRAEVKDGHEIANHTFSHVTLTKIPEDEVLTEYLACSDVVKMITGKAPKYCRPPGGEYDTDTIHAAARLGLTTVLWTDDPGDFAMPGKTTIENRVLKRMGNGSIILLHDGVQQTLDILPQIVQTARAKGYKFVTISELARNRT